MLKLIRFVRNPPKEWPWRDANPKTLVIRTETELYAMCIGPTRIRIDSIGKIDD